MLQRDDWHLTDVVEHQLGQGDPFAAAVRSTRMPMIITDPKRSDNPIIFANEAFQKLTGYEKDEILGRNCRFLQGPNTDKPSIEKVRQAIIAGESIEIDLLNYRKDGSSFWNALYMSPVRDSDKSIRYFFASQLDVTDRIMAQAALSERAAEINREVAARTSSLQAALDAKTLLLHEVDHRVKNNLLMVASLIRLQLRQTSQPELKEVLKTTLERIDAMAGIHRRLYQSDDILHIDAGGLVASLAEEIVATSGRQDIRVELDVAPIQVSSRKAGPLGLVLSEAITNSIKHGFNGERAGVLKVSAKQSGSSGVIIVEDDGPGFDLNKPRTGSLGLTLMARIAKQLGGTVTWKNMQPGASVTIGFET